MFHVEHLKQNKFLMFHVEQKHAASESYGVSNDISMFHVELLFTVENAKVLRGTFARFGNGQRENCVGVCFLFVEVDVNAALAHSFYGVIDGVHKKSVASYAKLRSLKMLVVGRFLCARFAYFGADGGDVCAVRNCFQKALASICVHCGKLFCALLRYARIYKQILLFLSEYKQEKGRMDLLLRNVHAFCYGFFCVQAAVYRFCKNFGFFKISPRRHGNFVFCVFLLYNRARNLLDSC